MNVSTSTFQTRRRRLKKVEEEENAATLQLGQEFQLKQINHQGEEEELIALNLSEARLVIKEALIERRRAFKRSQRSIKKKHLKHENANDETTAVEDDDDDLDEDDVDADDDDFMHSETREKELESIDVLLEQTTGGNNKDLKNTMQYLTNFSRFRDQETVGAVIQLLKSTGLHPFEVAQLGSLACDTADEAKTLIPSLNNKISDDELERILKELSNLETLY
ncbi:Rpb4p [Saccharomyces cerevisiae x Saccharomyces kudriavzevii VIN7]|uniref:Rpb4p n=1 Tax=Saccharomyces cerevisiae x Saccharomyces kudriavzevii (strain VIN7) TaxID=1095631 RepID=H0GWN6_SACCK|nr:Rpb4p [Saccharomyces cerevisiae x Saccharomyces kudriavzevii VIN7]